MSWLGFFSAVGACCLAAGCQLLVTFETLPEGAGGGGGGPTCTAACCSAADCPAPADPCVEAVCSAGACGEQPIPDGADAGAQSPGDCKKNVCMAGAATPVGDDDPLDDGNACTADACEGGSPVTSPAPAATPCTSNGGAVCDGQGDCVQCLQDGDCPASTPVCDVASNKCVAATCANGSLDAGESDVDCGGSCAPCPVGDTCGADADCASGICQNGKCAAPSCDDGRQNGEETDVDCGGGCAAACGPGQGCDADADCQGGDCTGQGGTCVPNCADGVENGVESDVDCGGGDCPPCANGGDCGGVDANCASGFCDGDGVCATGGSTGATGDACGSNGECQSGFCVDGVCCTSTCPNTCEKCDLAGSVGTCTAVPAGTDPDSECPGASACAENNMCSGEIGQPCSAGMDCLSNFCVDGVCCTDLCNTLCRSCNLPNSEGQCAAYDAGTDPDDECPPGMFCDGANACTF